MSKDCPKCQTKNPDSVKFCGECGAPLEDNVAFTKTLETPTEELARGSVFAGRYEIIEELGKGGMGKVYRVEDNKAKEEIALKLIKPEIASDKKTIERFRNELTTARKITHKNVCRMYDLGEERERHYITMEYVSGQDLKGIINQMGQLTVGKAISIAKQICGGLAEAHSLGVVHRDLKSNNIMIDKGGNTKIMDFGIARAMKGKSITGAGVVMGTPQYMSPEQVEGKDVDQRTDIYSLGIILYEMLTDRVPFEGDTPLTVGVKQKTETPKDPKEFNERISEGLSRLILKCLEKERESRYQSADEVRSDLEKLENGLPASDRVVPQKRPLTSKEITVQLSMKKVFVAAFVVIATFAAVLMIWSPWKQRMRTAKLLDMPSIAVLPFEDRSPQKDQGYLCDGLSESIINALTQIEGLRVPARSSSFSFKDKDNYIKEIGDKLNIKTVLEGSLQKADNRIRITAQLINVADESVLWSDQFNREEDHIFDIQDEITLAIVSELKVNLVGEDQENLNKRYTENIAAYNLYLQGRFFWNKRSKEGLAKAIAFFKQAIENDPNYAIAYAGLADSYLVSSAWGYIPPLEAYPKAKEAALKSLEIDNLLAEAHTALASVYMDYEWEWEKAEKEFKRAIELNPSYATAHHWYLEYLSVMGDFDDAIREGKRAQELDPLSPMINASLGSVLTEMGELDSAIVQLQKTIEMHPSFNQIHYYLGCVYLKKGMYEEALREFNTAGNKAYVGISLAKMGNVVEARKLLENLIAESKVSNITYKEIAELHFSFGDYDQGFAYLEKACEEREFMMKFIGNDFRDDDNIRSDPRFKMILGKMNLD